MTIKEINTNELEIKQSDMMLVVFSTIGIVIGIGLLAAPITNASNWWLALAGLAVIGVSIAFALFFPKNRRAVLRKGGNSEVVEMRTLTKKITASSSFNTNDIVGVGLDTNTSYETDRESDGSTTTRQVRKSRLYVTLQNGSQILLGKGQTSGPGTARMGIGFSFGNSMSSNTPLSNEASRISQFLGVPLNGNTAGVKINNLISNAVDTLTDNVFGEKQPPAQPTATPAVLPPAPAPAPQATPPSSDQTPTQTPQS